jgi:hypothetical protein
MGGGGSVTGGTGSSCGSGIVRLARSGVGRECGRACFSHANLATGPGARRFDGLSGSIVVRVLLLEKREYTLSAIGGPERL